MPPFDTLFLQRPSRQGRPGRPVAAGLLILTVMLGFAGTARGGVEAAQRTHWTPMVVAQAPGDSRAEPVPLGEAAAAGPWRMTVVEVVTGPEATERVTEASAVNEPPRSGFTYVAVRVRAENAGDRPLPIGSDDFALTGASGLVRRFTGALAPNPALAGTVEASDAMEGWVVLGAPADEENLLLIYDSLALSGTWADGVFALEEGAAIPDLAAPVDAPNDAGVEVGAPATMNEPVVTADWSVEILEVVEGAAVFDLVDFRTGALGADQANDIDPWLALRVKVTNVRTGGGAAFFPPNAFGLADEAGASVPDVLTLTPPFPDISGTYYPGASREGWVTFELPEAYAASGLTLVRFLPYRTDPDPRFLSWR